MFSQSYKESSILEKIIFTEENWDLKTAYKKNYVARILLIICSWKGNVGKKRYSGI